MPGATTLDAARMEEALIRWFADPSLMWALLSAARDKSGARVKAQPATVRGKAAVQLEYQERDGRVRHANLSPGEAAAAFAAMLRGEYRQANARFWRSDAQILARKDAFLLSEKPAMNAPGQVEERAAHDREKEHILRQGDALPFLVELGILSPQGRVVRDMGPKFRQINRFLEYVRDLVPELPEGPLHVADFGCGKSYLTFALYHYLARTLGREVVFTGVDLKQDVVAHCASLAERVGATGMRFICGDVHRVRLERADLVVSLHACDTATDAALAAAVSLEARVILAVPCCHHELAGQIASGELELILKHGILKQRFAELATDALRAEILEIFGYRAQVVEFIDAEATARNLMIRAVRRKAARPDAKAREAAEKLMDRLHADPALWRMLCGETAKEARDG